MDENKITPELDNATETENEQEQVVIESPETVEQTDETEATTSEQDAINDESESDGLEPVAEEEIELGQPEAPKKKKRKGLKIVLGIVIAIVLLFVGLIVAALISINADTPKLSVDADDVAISIDDVEINAGEFLYMYSQFSSYYSYYYTSDQLLEYATEQLVYVNSLYKKAVDAGYTLSEEDYAEIDAVIESIEVQAETNSITVEEIIEEYYFCEGYTVDMFRKYLEKEYLANNYYTDEVAKIEATYTGENALEVVETEYSANKVNYDLSDASYAYFDATEDDAQETVDAVIAKVNGGSSFEDALDSVAEIKSLEGYTMSVVETNFSEDVANWLFEMSDDAYVNGAGAVKSFTEDDVIYIVYVNDEPARDEQIPVTVDYIVVKADTDTTVKSESELLLAAKATATSILKEYEATEMTANDFYTLEDEYYNSDNELISAGSFESVTNDGSYDEDVAAWMFDSARQIGDYALVAGDGCYYILYFTQADEYAVWYQEIASTLLDSELVTWSESIISAYEDVTVKNEDVINAVVEYVDALYSSYSY